MISRPTLGELKYFLVGRGLFHPDIQKHVLDDEVIVFYRVSPPHDENDDPRLQRVGFDFMAFEWCGCPGECLDKEDPNNTYWGPETEVEYFANGEAYFDGVRHLWFGHESTNNEGYHYYPHLDSLKRLAEWLAKMEEEHCWNAPRNEKGNSS